MHERYGADRSALVAAFPTYRPRGAVRDLGKALALPPEEIDRVAKMVGFHERGGEIERDVVAAIGARARAPSRAGGRCSALCGEAMGLPRHSSQHPGGMVISTRPLIDVCPVVPAAMEGRQIVQWDKDSCADAGFLKIDLLGLGMLSAVERCVEEIGRARGRAARPLADPARRRARPSNRSAPPRPPASSRSRAARRCRCCRAPCPRDLDDLTVQVALVRPGPIQGGAIHPYIERRKLLREDPDYEIPYEHPLLEPVLEETLGTIVFQEQVIEVAMALAGFSSSEAEGLRRAMSRKRSEEAIARAPPALPRRRRARNGVGRRRRERVWDQIKGFSGFGFPKAHSAAFGLLAYQSAWLRIHYGPGVPLLAAERAADGLLPARLARPRGAAARRPGGGARRQPQRRPLPRRARERGGAGRAGRARLRQGGARGGDGGAGRRARARRPLPGDRRPRLALRRRPRRARTAGLGRGPGRHPGGPARPGAAAARRSGRSGSRGAGRGARRGHPAGAAAGAARAAASWSRWASGRR